MVEQLQHPLPDLCHLLVTHFGCHLQVGLLGMEIERVLDHHVEPIEPRAVCYYCGDHRLQ
jgi:hypothetical protein